MEAAAPPTICNSVQHEGLYVYNTLHTVLRESHPLVQPCEIIGRLTLDVSHYQIKTPSLKSWLSMPVSSTHTGPSACVNSPSSFLCMGKWINVVGITEDTNGSDSQRAGAHVHICLCTSVWEKETGGCSGAPVHVPVTGCRLHGSSTALAPSHLAGKERCPSWPRSNWIAAIGLATWKLGFSFINTQVTSDIPCHTAGPLNGGIVRLENY